MRNSTGMEHHLGEKQVPTGLMHVVIILIQMLFNDFGMKERQFVKAGIVI